MTNLEDKPVNSNNQAEPADKQDKQRPTTENYKGDKAASETEHGGPKGLEPTRYGDWERNGRCTDF